MAKISNKKTIKKKSNKIWCLITVFFAIVIFTLVAVIFSSYALWNDTETQKYQNLIATGCFSVSLVDQLDNGDINNINLTNSYPLSDDKGQKLTPYMFTIKNTCNVNAMYKISLSTLSNSTLNSQYIKYLFNDNNNVGTIMKLSTAANITLDNETLSVINSKNSPNYVNVSHLLGEGTLNAGESRTFNLRMWMSINADNSMMNKGFYGVLSVTSVSSN